MVDAPYGTGTCMKISARCDGHVPNRLCNYHSEPSALRFDIIYNPEALENNVASDSY
jgi:hypothetical protein